MTKNWRGTCVSPDTNMRSTLECLEESALQIVLVTDGDQKLLGVVTDGDARRALLKGLGMETAVSEFMVIDPQCGNVGDSREMLMNRMRSGSIHQMPIIDDSGVLVDIILAKNKGTLPNNVVLMAGGSGVRLRPLTSDIPKPMLHIGNRPILETIISQLHNFGFVNFHISLNYLGEQIEAHFDDGTQWGISIKYLKENMPLGTAGSLSLLEQTLNEPIIVMNSDLLTKLNFEHLLAFHNAHNSSLTVCVRDYSYVLPYGIIEVEGQNLMSLQEKPQKKVLVNAGIYIIDPHVIDLIKPNSYTDMTDIIQQLIKNKDRPCVFPIHEYWLDIGQKHDFQRAEDEFLDNF